jgi:hypothetical protein
VLGFIIKFYVFLIFRLLREFYENPFMLLFMKNANIFPQNYTRGFFWCAWKEEKNVVESNTDEPEEDEDTAAIVGGKTLDESLRVTSRILR